MLKLIIKIFLSTILLLATLIGLGVTGVYFYIWPTSLNDQTLSISDATTFELTKLLHEKKFTPAPFELYFGAPSEQIRIEAQEKTNLLLSMIVRTVKTNPKKSAVLIAIKNTLPCLDSFDSEEKDRALYYLEKQLEILNIQDSNELLNVWRYGFPYGWFLQDA